MIKIPVTSEHHTLDEQLLLLPATDSAAGRNNQSSGE